MFHKNDLVSLAVDVKTATGRFYAYGAGYVVRGVSKPKKGTPQRLELAYFVGEKPTASEPTFYVDADFATWTG
jgi:hypothetical protein